jgi:predicted  nucleic acid-binding Zn-ribbon protein
MARSLGTERFFTSNAGGVRFTERRGKMTGRKEMGKVTVETIRQLQENLADRRSELEQLKGRLESTVEQIGRFVDNTSDADERLEELKDEIIEQEKQIMEMVEELKIEFPHFYDAI